MGNYEDLRYKSRPPVPDGHPRMPLQNRAKLFSPFAALRGYGKRIAQEDEKKGWTHKRVLSQEEIDRLSEKLKTLEKGMVATIVYFRPKDDDLGIYQEMTGEIRRIDPVLQELHIGDSVLRFEDIAELFL